MSSRLTAYGAVNRYPASQKVMFSPNRIHRFIHRYLLIALFFVAFTPVQLVKAADLASEFTTLPCTPIRGNGDFTIAGGKTNLSLSVSTSKKIGGAITSLKINGIETVNIDDMGREIQYAIFVGPNGWVNSPTEGGSDKNQWPDYPDGYPSEVVEGCATGNKLYTKSKMAYWVPDPKLPNRSPLSPYILSKTVEVGYHGIPNLIRSVARIHNVSTDNWYVDEAAAYSTPFRKVSLFDVKTKKMRQVDKSEFGTNYNGSTMFPFWYASHGTGLLSVSDGQYSITPYIIDSSGDWSYMYGWAGDPTTGYTYTNSTHTIRNISYTKNDTDYYFENFILVSANSTTETEIGNLVTQIPRTNIGPHGLFESADCATFTGWAGDKDQPDMPIDIQFIADSGSAHEVNLGKTQTTVTREASICYTLGTNTSPCKHGFSFTPPDTIKDGKKHTIFAYGIDAQTGEKFDLQQNRRDITCVHAASSLSSPTGSISSTTPQFVWYVVSGATRYWLTVSKADNTYLLNKEISPDCNTVTCWITPQLTLTPGNYYFKVTGGTSSGWGQASTVNNFTVVPVKTADINKDGKVDIYDYNTLISNFGKTGSAGFIPADINKDGKIDLGDYNMLIENFGK